MRRPSQGDGVHVVECDRVVWTDGESWPLTCREPRLRDTSKCVLNWSDEVSEGLVGIAAGHALLVS